MTGDKLTTVHDIYGRRVRVAKADLENTAWIMVPMYNQYGNRLVWKPGRPTVIHRENIADGPCCPVF